MCFMIVLLNIIVIACFSAWLICLATKLGFVEWVQINGNEFFHKMFSCQFCLSWWTNVLVCVVLSVILLNPTYLLYPFITTTITRKLL